MQKPGGRKRIVCSRNSPDSGLARRRRSREASRGQIAESQGGGAQGPQVLGRIKSFDPNPWAGPMARAKTSRDLALLGGCLQARR